MPTTRRTRIVAADVQAVWSVVCDPHHLPRWWPRVTRVEGVDADRWTQVFMTKKGRPVRADYRLLASERSRSRSWRQELEDTPFERVLGESVTEVRLEPVADQGTRVTIEQRQRLRGFARLGGLMVRRATRRLLDEALEGLRVACER